MSSRASLAAHIGSAIAVQSPPALLSPLASLSRHFCLAISGHILSASPPGLVRLLFALITTEAAILGSSATLVDSSATRFLPCIGARSHQRFVVVQKVCG